MKNYPVYKNLNLTQIAHQIAAFWQQNQTFSASINNREGRPIYTFYEGPPSANGEPGIHHILSRTIKDLFCRYKTLQGYQVKRKSGWDTHGLPVELQVEKALKITKEAIGKTISIEDYNSHCRETVMRYQAQWEKLNTQLGYWIDVDNPYRTCDTHYIETLWHLLQKFYQKGLLYKGYSIQPYSPAAGTGLSSHELNQPGCYKKVKDITVVAQFKKTNTEDEYFLAWTTTPWTLPANSALAVDEKTTYVCVRTYNTYTHQPIKVILAQEALSNYFPHDAGQVATYQPGSTPIPWQIIAYYEGKDLVGETYEQLLPYVKPSSPAFQVVAGDFVTTDEGTGIVHISPTFGAEDMRLAKKLHIPAITVRRENTEVPIVDKQGRFVEEITDWALQYVKSAYAPDSIREQADYQSVDQLITRKLKQENKAFLVTKHEHNYPHCWRTDKPILYYPLDTWAIATTKYKEQLIALNKTINWNPVSTGVGRFENWLENLVDWNLSRDRFWGTPLPIWQTEDQTEERCIGSIEELRDEVYKAIIAGYMEEPLPEDLDLHRPYVDQIILVSPSGKKMHRVSDLIDVWFDAGSMPYAQWHYPFQNKALFAQHFPADFIAEGVDQTRGWFFTLHVIAVMLFDSVAFKNVISNGLILDKYGNKMSKRLGNSINPSQIIEQHGVDALRWYMIINASPGDNLKFDPEGLIIVIRKFFFTLHNTYNFFASYANLDHFTALEEDINIQDRPEIDQWILSKLHTLIRKVTEELNRYEPTKASRLIQDFVVDELSNWYVRLNRKRFWKSEVSQDKLAAYQTLHTCLINVAKLTASFAPFYADKLYQDLQINKGEVQSVHLSDFPKADKSIINETLETKMMRAKTIVSMVHSLRKKHNIKVRQPLSKLIIPITDKDVKAQIEVLADLILIETNVKQIAYIDDHSEFIVKKIKPNFNKIGRKHTTRLNAIVEALAKLSTAEIQELEQEGRITLLIDTVAISLTLEDVSIVTEDIPGWSIVTQEDISVAIDVTITPELHQEGIARDLINRIQNIRKDKDFELQDKIKLTIATTSGLVQEAIRRFKSYIGNEIQAVHLDLQEEIPTSFSNHEMQEIEIDNEMLYIGVTKYAG